MKRGKCAIGKAGTISLILHFMKEKYNKVKNLLNFMYLNQKYIISREIFEINFSFHFDQQINEE